MLGQDWPEQGPSPGTLPDIYIYIYIYKNIHIVYSNINNSYPSTRGASQRRTNRVVSV